ncbi:MAG: hypothetical protein A3G38_03000 [Omnitrophica WOR_2 bacterium RIFCSPLOWO2_12_FULL_51_8]|nr:MAG: hypothetical protein A3G38_03000 [Omnitrophica WOR_2 bacterium RIFCSPLOWO2_12_FULL_51_8]
MKFFLKRKKNIRLNTEARGDLALLEKADVIVTGTFEGDIRIQSELTVEKGAAIRGRISAENVIVKGKISGDVYAVEGVRLRPGGELRGDVKASLLLVERGACFWGKCEIMQQSAQVKKETQMTPGETAQFLQIDVDTLIELAENKKIPASHGDNGAWFFDRIDLERWISENNLTSSSVAAGTEVQAG